MTIVMAFAACSANKDAEVNSFVAEMDSLTAEIVRAVDENRRKGLTKRRSCSTREKPS